MALVMLDTSACIRILRGEEMPEEWRLYSFAISSVVEAELWAGVYHAGGKVERKKVELFLNAVEVFPFESRAAEYSGEVLGTLATKGERIGDFDSQIAGHAIAKKAKLITCNVKHFSRIEHLKILNWD